MDNLIGLKVFVYYNLHRKVFSIKAMEGVDKGRVVGYSTHVLLRNAKTKVSQAGRLRVLREGRKNVHAGLVGVLESLGDLGRLEGKSVVYNPYKYSTFVLGGCLTEPPENSKYYLHNKRVTLLG